MPTDEQRRPAGFIMWFAIAPVMPNVKKVKCADPEGDICVKCALKYPADDLFYKKEGEIKKGEVDPAIGASDPDCKMCYPYDSRVKRGQGCGGLGLTGLQVKDSTVVAISGTIILRVLIGPISDGIGIRTAYAILLCLSSIPGFLLAATQDYIPLVICRFIIGFAGSSFVLTQLWTTTMYDLSVVGIANATSAGWGNLGGGVAQLLNSSIFRACKLNGMTTDSAWRTTVGWSPAVILLLGISVFLFSDDCPYGNFKDLKKNQNAKDAEAAELEALKSGGEPGKVAAASLIDAAKDWKVWVLHLCYAFSFGVELIVNGNIVSYFTTNWAMTQTDAGLFGSVFGLLNICMRSFGGYQSDLLNNFMGFQGRMWALFIQSVLMGIALISFSALTPDVATFGGMTINLILWGSLTNMTEGGTFAVVPYVMPHAVGGVAGIVGAGGNVGALLGGIMISKLRPEKASRQLAFCGLGWGAVASGLLLPALWIPGQGSMLRKPPLPPAEQPAGKQEQQPAMQPGPQPAFVPAQPVPMQ
jgi:NNP family nitrate/nitrite transporter-like MFS transporter